MTEITMFAIRHNPTGFLLPCAKGRNGRGGSHVEPTDPRKAMPRYLETERQAKAVLGSWLRGKVHCDRYGGYDDYEEHNRLVPVPTRRREDMEIIPVRVIIPSQN